MLAAASPSHCFITYHHDCTGTCTVRVGTCRCNNHL